MMKTMRLWLLWGALSSLVTIKPASAQTPATLGGQLYLGLSINGTMGTAYAIQATTNLAQTNGWLGQTFVQLPATNYLWIDTSAPATGQRFYRHSQGGQPPLRLQTAGPRRRWPLLG